MPFSQLFITLFIKVHKSTCLHIGQYFSHPLENSHLMTGFYLFLHTVLYSLYPCFLANSTLKNILERWLCNFLGVNALPFSNIKGGGTVNFMEQNFEHCLTVSLCEIAGTINVPHKESVLVYLVPSQELQQLSQKAPH